MGSSVLIVAATNNTHPKATALNARVVTVGTLVPKLPVVYHSVPDRVVPVHRQIGTLVAMPRTTLASVPIDTPCPIAVGLERVSLQEQPLLEHQTTLGTGEAMPLRLFALGQLLCGLGSGANPVAPDVVL